MKSKLAMKKQRLLLKAVERRRLKLGDTHPHTQQSLKNLIELYKAWGKPEKAEEWRAILAQTENTRKRHGPFKGPEFLDLRDVKFP